MKHVCIVRHSCYPDIPPTRRNAETLVAHGYEVDVICSKKQGQKGHEIVNGVRVHRLPLVHHRGNALRYIFEYSAFFLLATWVLNWLFLKRRFRVVEADAMPDFLVFTTLFLKLFGIKVILNMLDFVPHLYADRFKAKPNHPIVRLLELVEKASMSYADHIIFPHSEVQGRYVENQGLADSKTSVILNVPDENIFYPRIAPSAEGKTFQLISHGSILEKYGVQTLIKAVPLLIPSIPELQVRIVGSGEYRPQLEALVQDLNLEDRVHFTGFIPMEQIPDIICQADIGVITTIIQMMPTKLFEYVALGRPVITTIFPAVTDYFSDGTVMYYEAGDEYALARCVLELYHNPERRASLATLASTVYQGYRWDTMKYEYLKVFEQLTGPQHVAGGGGQIRK